VVHDFYGTTETGWVTLVGAHEMLARPNTVGRSLPGAGIIIMDDHGRPVPTGEVGRIFIDYEQVIEGYYQDEAATRQSRVGEAHETGDLGFLDRDGYLYLAGRADDMIVSGGVNVYPAEIEQALGRHPAVQDVAVVGLPDQDLGERVAAFLVGPAKADQPALEAWCRERLAGFKLPRVWHFVDELPRNPTGKVLKRELREQTSPKG
jgi:acyl-CoA synthetase (AMP-forming)/AMP-acid ligase II